MATKVSYGVGVSRAPDIILEDRKTSGSNGGSSVVNSRVTRDLNTEVRDVNGECTLSANKFRLPMGQYYMEASAPAFESGQHQIFLRNLFYDTDSLIGRNGYGGTLSDKTQSDSHIAGVFTVLGSTHDYSIEHYTNAARASIGLGVPTPDGNIEIYTVVKIWRIL